MAESLDLLWQLWPYLVLGIVLTTVIRLYVSKKKLIDFFNSMGSSSIVVAALVGVISPLGSYVVIPLSAALFATGIPLHVLMSLLVASPLINPNLFFLTSGAFGLEMALLRTISAFLLGISAGYITLWALKKRWLVPAKVLKPGANPDITRFSQPDANQGWSLFWSELYKMTKYVSKYFFLAIILAAVIKIMISPKQVTMLFGSNEFLSVLFSTGAGVPFYVCGGAAIPVVQQLAELGMSKGAVLAFFISGPATKISNLALMNVAFHSRVFLIYILVGMLGAFVLGMVYNLI